MARDRLRLAQQQQQQQGGYSSYGNPPTQRQTRPNPYDQRDEGYGQQNQYGGGQNDSYQQAYQGNSYELQQVGNGGSYGNAAVDDMTAFYNEIQAIQDEIRNFSANVTQISRLHSSLLSNVEPTNSRANQQLENLIEETRQMIGGIRNRINALQLQPVDEKAANMRKPQIELVREKFKKSIEKYQEEEKEYRDKYKDRMARQYRIVNPNATDAEVAQVVNSDQDVQIFAQAAMGNRYADSQRAYREVQQRHEEVKRIERNLVELAQLMNDLSLIVEQQNDTITNIHQNAETAASNIEAGKVHTDTALVKARGYRKKRWICLGLTLIILVIVGIAVGVEVSKNVNNNDNNSGGNNNGESSSA